MVDCPNCGALSLEEIFLHNLKLRKQNFEHSPILPTCKKCGAEVFVSCKCEGGKIFVLNGTCGSGKSTVAEILAEKNFFAIDGDCVLQVVKHKNGGAKVDFREPTVFDEIAKQIDILSMFGENFVLSHVIMPEDLQKLIEIFRARNLEYHFFLLKPEFQTAVERCAKRICHGNPSVTPTEWVKYFHDILIFDKSFKIVDNTKMSAEQTADYILQN
jgi:predicted ABC-type ATPase